MGTEHMYGYILAVYIRTRIYTVYRPKGLYIAYTLGLHV